MYCCVRKINGQTWKKVLDSESVYLEYQSILHKKKNRKVFDKSTIRPIFETLKAAKYEI